MTVTTFDVDVGKKVHRLANCTIKTASESTLETLDDTIMCCVMQ